MNQKTKTIIKSLAFFLVFALTVVSFNVYAAFTSPPPGLPGEGNVESPINTSEEIQIKKGGWIVAFERIIGILLVGGKAEFADTIKIYGGNPGVDKVLVSDNVGLASWRDVSTLPGWGGGNGNPTPPPPPAPQGVVPVSLGGTGLTTIADHSIWVANAKDVVSVLTPAGGNSIRVNAAGTSWESFMPLTSSGSGGTPNRISKFTGPNTLDDSGMTDDGTTITTSGNFRIGNNLVFSNVGEGLTSNVTNYSLPDGVNIQLEAIPSSSNWTIQGFGGDHTHGRVVYIMNRGPGEYKIKNNSTTTTASNRVQMIENADLTMTAHKTIMLFYDTGFGGGSRWVQVF